jgi:hypothetical protein
MCPRSGRSPISTMGSGLEAVSSDRREPMPPARMTTLTTTPLPQMPSPARLPECTWHRSCSRVVRGDQRAEVLRHHHKQDADHDDSPQVSPFEPDPVRSQHQQ